MTAPASLTFRGLILAAVAAAALSLLQPVSAGAQSGGQLVFQAMVCAQDYKTYRRVPSGSCQIFEADGSLFSATFINEKGELEINAPAGRNSTWLLQSGAFNDRRFSLEYSSDVFEIKDQAQGGNLQYFQQNDGSYILFYSWNGLYITDQGDLDGQILGPISQMLPDTTLTPAARLKTWSAQAKPRVYSTWFQFWPGPEGLAPGMVVQWTAPDSQVAQWFRPWEASGTEQAGISWTTTREYYDQAEVFGLHQTFDPAFENTRDGLNKVVYWLADEAGNKSNTRVEHILINRN